MSAPRTIWLDTPHYILRSIEPGDDGGTWSEWLMDRETARVLNVAPVRLSVTQFRAYAASFDGEMRHLLGIFDKSHGRMVGVRALYIDGPRNEFQVNVIVGEPGERNLGARTETAAVMYRYFFDELGFEAARGAVVAGNEPILRVVQNEGWVLERREPKQAASGQGMIELLHYRLTRDAWRRRRR